MASSVNKTLLPWQHILQLLTFHYTERILKHFYIFIVCNISTDLWSWHFLEASNWQNLRLSTSWPIYKERFPHVSHYLQKFSSFSELWNLKTKSVQPCIIWIMHILTTNIVLYQIHFSLHHHFYMGKCCMFLWMCVHTCI